MLSKERQQFLFCCICSILIATTNLVDMISASSSEDLMTEIKEGNLLHRTDMFESDEDDDIDDLNLMKSTNIDHNWDILIFTQQWPITFCYHWKEEDKSHECNLPTRKEFWTIHGIWPTKYGHIGPSFCNKTADFDINQLKSIADNLRLAWPNIETGQDYDSLWRHEWLKHGTCASLVEQLNNELKYFEQGLMWRGRYLISEILDNSNIHPDSNNTVIGIQTALIKELGKNPTIHCIYDHDKDISYLAEIRICFNKSLELTDCDGIPGDQISIDYPGGKVNTNCQISKPVHYPSAVPPIRRQSTWKFPVVNLYKLVHFIMWFTM